jgi:hypothetical protein
MYWGMSAGMLVAGILMLSLSAYAVVCFSRAYRAGEVTLSRRRNPVGMTVIGIAFVLILFALAAKQCSHPPALMIKILPETAIRALARRG